MISVRVFRRLLRQHDITRISTVNRHPREIRPLGRTIIERLHIRQLLQVYAADIPLGFQARIGNEAEDLRDAALERRRGRRARSSGQPKPQRAVPARVAPDPLVGGWGRVALDGGQLLADEDHFVLAGGDVGDPVAFAVVAVAAADAVRARREGLVGVSTD